jgi:hypothetical protein
MNQFVNMAKKARDNMRRAFVLGIALVLVVATPFGVQDNHRQPTKQAKLSQGLQSIERNWTANIILVGYDPSLIDEPLLLQGLPTVRSFSTDAAQITYNIQYQIAHADAAYNDELRQVMLDNSINGSETGTRLDDSALLYQKNNLDEPQRIFYPRAGRVIDGYAVEDWLEENPYTSSPALGYTLYLVNFSEFDSADHSLEHWYDYHPIDPDTGQKQDWFRLEWDNALNPNVTMDYPFFGGRYNLYVVDPSAHQWYLKWCKIWWSEEINTTYDFWTQDLEGKAESLDFAISADVDALNVYLRECIWDPITQLLFPYQHQPAQFVDVGRLKALVFCMDVATGTSVQSLEWVTNAEMQKAHLEELYPFIQWQVDVDYLDIDEEPSWANIFQLYSSIEPDGTTVVDGSGMFNSIYYVKRPSYVVDDGNINVFGVVFIKKQMEMHVYGRAYTGLGGGGQTVIWKSWERYYRSDGATPKDGISATQLHETMHAIGFAHSWQHEHYASDFYYGPMGYFAEHNGTSTFEKNWVQGTYLDQMDALLWSDFIDEQANLGLDERPATYSAESAALASFESARNSYNEMDWHSAYSALVKARDWTRRMMFSSIDDMPPLIYGRGTNPSDFWTGPFTYWAMITDNLAGLENVTLYAQVDNGVVRIFPMAYNGYNWSVSVPFLEHTSNLTIWVVAWDWGMNRAEGGVLTHLGAASSTLTSTTTNALPDILTPIIVAASVATVIVVVGGIVIRKRE